MSRAAEPITISKGDRALMDELLRGGNTPQKVAFRISIVLGAAAGIANAHLARDLSTTKSSVLKWRARYREAGLEGILEDSPRSGRKKTISVEKEAAIVQATLQTQSRLRPPTGVHAPWRTHKG